MRNSINGARDAERVTPSSDSDISLGIAVARRMLPIASVPASNTSAGARIEMSAASTTAATPVIAPNASKRRQLRASSMELAPRAAPSTKSRLLLSPQGLGYRRLRLRDVSHIAAVGANRRIGRGPVALATASATQLRAAAAKDSRDSTIGLVFGWLVILVGAAMMFGGVAGIVKDLVFKFGTTERSIASAPVGVVFAVIGLPVIIVTRPTVASA
jgi:hypothetical protein